MGDMKHLAENTRIVAQLDAKERIAHLRADRWIDYPRALEALDLLEQLREMPERTRMPCLLIHGDSGIGKTMIIEKFRRAHPPTFNRQKGLQDIDVVAVQMPPAPQERRLYGQILLALNAPHRPSDRLSAVEHTALTLLHKLRPRMIIVDEVHHLLAGSPRDQRASLNLLKFLANDLKCSVVALGTRDALAAMHTDRQIASRFADFELPRWQEDQGLRRFLVALERLLPLREPSQLSDRSIAATLLRTSSGITGNMTSLITQAAEIAIRSGEERITVNILGKLTTPSIH
jgi:hypothetical protein